MKVAALLLLVPLVGSWDELPVLGLKEGQELSYRFTEEATYDCKHMTIVSDGRQTDRDSYPLRGSTRLERNWVDKLGPIEDGRPTTLERSYGELPAEVEFMLQTGDGREPDLAMGGCLLAKNTVGFKWNDKAESYDASPPEGAQDELKELVKGLDALVDGRGWLPPAELESIEAGSTWSVDPAELRLGLRPGGELAYHLHDLGGMRDPDPPAMYGQISGALGASGIEGECQATWKGHEEVNGQTLGRIEIEFEVSLSADTTEWMNRQGTPFEMAQIAQGASNAEFSADLVGTGVLHWNLEEQRLESLTLDADGELRVRYDFYFEYRGIQMGGSYDVLFDGGTKTELRVSAD